MVKNRRHRREIMTRKAEVKFEFSVVLFYEVGRREKLLRLTCKCGGNGIKFIILHNPLI